MEGNRSEGLVGQVTWAVGFFIARNDLNLGSIVEANVCKGQL